ncbi:hypothetical protein PENSPDRAFT_694209 [Peniophora sp. CONT]|nr:hypothetical protein PENSPDRAFT_694209 [Peniophora sp. CONT]
MQNGSLVGPPPPIQALSEAEYHRAFAQDYWISTAQARLPTLVPHIPHVSVVDDHIHGLEHTLSYAKYVRNLSLPALKLPIELLSLVFEYLFADWAPTRLRIITAHQPTRFLYRLNCLSAAMHVCHVWRNTLIHCPSLWSFVNTTLIPPRLAPWFLEFSRNVPLHLYLELSRPDEKINSFEILRSVLIPPQMSRLFALNLDLCHLSIVPALTTAILPSQMPNLTYLHIGLAPDLIPTNHNVIYIPLAWLSKFAPNLDQLHLHQCALTWPESGELVTLPSLRIFEYSIKDAARYVSPKATLTLEPNAYFLGGPETLPSADLYTIKSEPTIVLSEKLQSLTICSIYAPLAPLISLLRVPRGVCTSLTTLSCDDFSALPLRRFCGADRPPHTMLFSVMTISGEWSYSPQNWEYDIFAWANSPSSVDWTSASREEPSLHVHGDWNALHGELTNPLTEIDLSELRLLVFVGEENTKVTDLGLSEGFYRKATKLERLEVANWKVAIDFFRALVPQPGSEVEPLFPRLADIYVGVATEISEQGHEPKAPIKCPAPDELIRIVSCLAARCARGYPLQRIHFPSHLEDSSEWIDRVKETGVLVKFV